MESQKMNRNRTATTQDEFMEQVRQSLAVNFDLEERVVEGDQYYDLIARYFNVSGRIFITPKDIIDRMETFEQVYVKCFGEMDEEQVQAYFEEICRRAVELNPKKDHFQTDLTGVMVCTSVSPGIEKQMKKLRFAKTFRFYFRGFCEVRMVCVDLLTSKIMTNPSGKMLKKVYTIKK